MTTLKEEEPFAFVVNSECLDDTCSFCLENNKPVRKCKGCQTLSYCDKNCQNRDWVNHKKECRFLQTGIVPPMPSIRLAMRILVKSEVKLAQKAFNGRTWDSLDNNVTAVKSRTSELDFLVSFLSCFCRHAKKAFSFEEITEVYSKVLTNYWPIIDYKSFSPIGAGIYIGLSIHKHSCIPDAQIIFNGPKASFSSFEEQAVYSSNLTFSHTGHSPWLENRKDLFRQVFLRECTCPICTDANHIMNRMGSSCRVTCCEDAAGILDDENSIGPYMCNKCGAASRIEISEVKRVEAKILSKIEEIKELTEFEKIRILVQECEMTLSNYNFRFVNLFVEVLNWVTKRKHTIKEESVHRMGIYLSDKLLKAASYYYHDSDTRKTRFIKERAIVRMGLNLATELDLDQALIATERTYGKCHSEYARLETMIQKYWAEKAAKLEDDYKKMCQYGW